MIDHRDVAGLRSGDLVTAISLWEPWASLMAAGAKKIETRGWYTRHRGPLLICAASRKVQSELRAYLNDEVFQVGLAGLAPINPADVRPIDIDGLNFGHAVALVNLEDCCPTEDLRDSSGEYERYFGNFASGRFGWVTSGLRRLRPFPVKGKQRLFRIRLPADLEDWDSPGK